MADVMRHRDGDTEIVLHAIDDRPGWWEVSLWQGSHLEQVFLTTDNYGAAVARYTQAVVDENDQYMG